MFTISTQIYKIQNPRHLQKAKPMLILVLLQALSCSLLASRLSSFRYMF